MNYSASPYRELQQEARRLGLPASGDSATLAARIQGALAHHGDDDLTALDEDDLAPAAVEPAAVEPADAIQPDDKPRRAPRLPALPLDPSAPPFPVSVEVPPPPRGDRQLPGTHRVAFLVTQEILRGDSGIGPTLLDLLRELAVEEAVADGYDDARAPRYISDTRPGDGAIVATLEVTITPRRGRR